MRLLNQGLIVGSTSSTNPPTYLGNVTTGLTAFWDGNSYTTGQTLSNACLVPDDGSVQTAYDMNFGASSGSGSDDPTFVFNKFTYNGSQYFSAIAANTTFLNSLHKTGAGNSWTWWTKVLIGPGVSAATVVAGGSGYAVGNTITVSTNGSAHAVLAVSAIGTGGAVTAVTVTTAGNYASTPSSPVTQTATSGSGTGATFTVNGGLMNDLFGTASITGDYGILIRVDSSGSFKLDQYTGAAIVTKLASLKLKLNTTYDLFASYDKSSDTLTFSQISNGAVTTQVVHPAGWTTGLTNNATHNWNLNANGSAGNKTTSGTTMFGQAFWDRVLTFGDITNVGLWSSTYYANTASVPGTVSSVAIMPQDGGADFAWVVANNGGATITDYIMQYKVHTDSSFTVFGHTASGAPACNVTGLTNGTLYDFKIQSINSVGTSAVSSVLQCTPLATGTAPYDIEWYSLGLPVNSAGLRQGQGSFVNILQPAVLTYESAWFGNNNAGTYVFNCPDGGATSSSGDSFCRTEFRNLQNIPVTTPTEDTVKFAVTACPDGHKTIVHQIHDPQGPWVKVVYTGSSTGSGQLRALMTATYGGPTVTLLLKSGLTNGDVTVSRIVYDGSNLLFYIDDSSTPAAQNPITRTGAQGMYYWKRGNYVNDDSFAGNIYTVVHYAHAGSFTHL